MDFIFSYWWNAIGVVLFLSAVTFCTINLFRKEAVVEHDERTTNTYYSSYTSK